MFSLHKLLAAIRSLFTLVHPEYLTRIAQMPRTDNQHRLAHNLLQAELTSLRNQFAESEERLENRLTERFSDTAKTLESYKWTFERFFNILTGVGILITIAGAVGLWQDHWGYGQCV
jgi:hypothetical protein